MMDEQTETTIAAQRDAPLPATASAGPGLHIILGIDPGLDGALAFMGPDQDVTIHDIPTHRLKRGGKVKREVDLTELARILDAAASTIAHVFLEQAGAMPKQGVTSSFAFGKGYGSILGIVAANFLPLTLVSPRRWKKALQVPKAKDGARARASQLLPRAAGNWPLVKHDGRAEAALIALYGSREMGRAP